MKPIYGKHDIEIIIQPLDDLDSGPPRLIPAQIFRRMFNTIFDIIKTADSEAHDKNHRSEFLISELKMGSNVFAIREVRRDSTVEMGAMDIVRNSIGSVYRSDFSRVQNRARLAKKIASLSSVIKPEYPAVANIDGEVIPLDAFFAKQAQRLKDTLNEPTKESHFFAGSVIGSFDGRLGNIDYRGAKWFGNLVLPGSSHQIECIFDRSKGEDEYNRCGNKRVSVTGRAIYTGETQIPERIEVMSINPNPEATEHIDIRGTLKIEEYFTGWGDDENKNLQ